MFDSKCRRAYRLTFVCIGQIKKYISIVYNTFWTLSVEKPQMEMFTNVHSTCLYIVRAYFLVCLVVSFDLFLLRRHFYPQLGEKVKCEKWKVSITLSLHFRNLLLRRWSRSYFLPSRVFSPTKGPVAFKLAHFASHLIARRNPKYLNNKVIRSWKASWN